jgi:hypothetical protein
MEAKSSMKEGTEKKRKRRIFWGGLHTLEERLWRYPNQW